MPYLLIAPTLIFLAAFFVYPMVEGLLLAIRDDEAKLPVLEEPLLGSDEVGSFPLGTRLTVLDEQGNVMEGELTDDLLTEEWFRVAGLDSDGDDAVGWSPDTRIRVRAEADDGTPLRGEIRKQRAAGAEPHTDLFEIASESAEVIARLDAGTEVDIVETTTLELWFLVTPSPEAELDDTTQGWAPSRFVKVFGEGETGVIDRATQGEFTTRFIEEMTNERQFGTAWRTTLLLIAIVVPLQFLLAMFMALVIHARVKGSSFFLYVYSIPMGMSDLAVGILFYALFTGNGFINSFLESIGLIEDQKLFLTADTRNWIIAAIVLAELWRATSIVMVIIVAGLQAIPDETLEAAELFGASYWKRVRHVMLPLLRPSIQVALILRTILAFQVFAVVIALNGSGDVVTVLANEAYDAYFSRNNNLASAYALFILVLSIASAVFYLRTIRSQAELAKT